MRNLMRLAGVLALVTAFALAQAQIVSPTEDTGDDAVSVGTDEASVNQTVTLDVPQATALHLDVTDLVFDMEDLEDQVSTSTNADGDGNMVCVYGSSPFDTTASSPISGQESTLPLGTYYDVEKWPNISIVNDGGEVSSYPPYELDDDGELVPGSKNHFVCYRSFILQKFSNGTQWDLSVERTDAKDGNPNLQHIYIQDNPCDTFGEVTGLYELNDGPIRLVPEDLGDGPTGVRSAADFERCGYKSWLDDLVVVAVKVNADYAGENVANLKYTLTTNSWWEASN